jgi:hypothetical protein
MITVIRPASNDIWGAPAETLQSEEDELFINTLVSILQVTREPIQ